MNHATSLLRNVAIIAHVDHGKTTLVDAILRQTGALRARSEAAERVLDSNPLEKERGITILAKNTAVYFTPAGADRPVKINVVDTPGHADFGGEVERILSMVDGCLLVVDAAEGPLPQTRYVLQKALAQRLAPVVVINKIDRRDARPMHVVDEVLELFIALGADDAQIDFPILYAAARAGVADTDLERALAQLRQGDGSIFPVLEAIVQHVPAPAASPGDAGETPQLMAAILDHDDYLGRIAIGRLRQGKLRKGDRVAYGRPGKQTRFATITGLFTFERLQRVPVEEAQAGDIVAVAGLEHLDIGDTVTDAEQPRFLPPLTVDEPTLTVIFRVNDSPLAGREGEFLTSRHLRDRLMREARHNVALRVSETDSPDAFLVAGRGELHLGILIETMRREGSEFAVSQPRPVLKEGPEGLLEPFERLTVDVPQEFVGAVMEMLGARRAELVDMAQQGTESVRLEFIVPARGLIGFRSQLLTETKGYASAHHTFHGFGPYAGPIVRRTNGSLVAWEGGTVTAYALESAQERGQLFVSPGDVLYEGMIVGAHSRPQDLDINVCRKRHVTNMRSSTAEIAVKLSPPRRFTVEEALAYIADDELVEVTPAHVRLRKAILDRNQRHALQKRARA